LGYSLSQETASRGLETALVGSWTVEPDAMHDYSY
jgi:hypothetical protein